MKVPVQCPQSRARYRAVARFARRPVASAPPARAVPHAVVEARGRVGRGPPHARGGNVGGVLDLPEPARLIVLVAGYDNTLAVPTNP